jgi:hypothetical protein
MMRWMEWLGRRIRLLKDNRDVEAELSDELEHHIDLETAELIRQGWGAGSARSEVGIRS